MERAAARCLTKIRLKGQRYTDSYVDRGQMASILWLRKIFLNGVFQVGIGIE